VDAAAKYVGWEWASRGHDVTVLDADGHVVDRWAFSHTEPGWAGALRRLARHGNPVDLPVIIERSSGQIEGGNGACQRLCVRA
jgi:hypothetical protein